MHNRISKNVQQIRYNHQMTIWEGSTSSLKVGVSSGLSSPMSTNRSGDARVSEYSLQKSSTYTWRDKDLFFSFSISSQQARILTIPCPVAAARCSFQSLSSDTLMSASSSPSSFSQPPSKPSRSSPLSQVQVPQLLKERFVSELQQDGPT